MNAKITPQQKTFLKIGGGILAAYILYRVLSHSSDSSSSAYDPTGNGTGSTANPNFNAANVADNLYNAMNEMGTDDDDITPILQGVSASQFGQVVAAFGKRPYNPVTGNIYAVWGFDLDSYNLKFWLKNELSDEAYAVLRKKYPNHL